MKQYKAKAYFDGTKNSGKWAIEYYEEYSISESPSAIVALLQQTSWESSRDEILYWIGFDAGCNWRVCPYEFKDIDFSELPK